MREYPNGTLAKEAAGVALLRSLLPAGGRLEEITDARSQWLGVDFIYHQGVVRSTFELKADYRAHDTGNAFVELVCDSVSDWPGWAYTSTAQYLAYLVMGAPELLVLPMSQVRARLGRWEKGCRRGVCASDGHKQAHGLLVPLTELRRLNLWHDGKGL